MAPVVPGYVLARVLAAANSRRLVLRSEPWFGVRLHAAARRDITVRISRACSDNA